LFVDRLLLMRSEEKKTLLLAYPVRERKMRQLWLVRVSGEQGRRKAAREGRGDDGEKR